MYLTVAYGTQASTVTIGRRWLRLSTTLDQLLLVRTTSTSMLLASTRRIATTVGTLSPSAA